MKKKLHLHQSTPKLELFYYTLDLVESQYVAAQVPEIPESSVEENSSVLVLGDGNEKQGGITGDLQVGIHVTWLAGKPAASSPSRHAGLMVVFNDLYKRLSPKIQKKLRKLDLGIGHLPGATAEIHES